MRLALHTSPRSTERGRTRAHIGSRASVPLPTLVESWVSEGIITTDQGNRILARAETRPIVTSAIPKVASARAEVPSLVVEGLGYLGGVIILASAVLIASGYWVHLGTVGRLTLVGGTALVLLVAGLAMPLRLAGVGERLRAVLWILSVLVFAGFLALLGDEQLALAGHDTELITAGGASMLAIALWWLRPHLAQQTVTMVGLMVTAAIVVNRFTEASNLPGLGAWAIGVIWLVLGWGGVLAPRRPVVALGSAAALFGGLTTAGSDAGAGVAVATAVAVVAAAVAFRDLLLLAVGAAGAMFSLPQAMTTWLPDAEVAPYLLLALGMILLLAAIRTARRKPVVEARPTARDYAIGAPFPALVLATLVAVTVAALAIADPSWW